jgi:uncharacterized protein
MKYLLVLLVVALALWLMFRGRGSNRVGGDDAERRQADSAKGGTQAKKPTPMLACAHCGLHLPRGDALLDAQSRPYCSSEHRDAGAA